MYITPGLLHLWLWREWWKLFGNGFNLDDFLLVDNSTEPITYMPHRMIKWFFDMFSHASKSPDALKIVQKLLGHDGPLNDGELLQTDIGAQLFSALSKADPSSSLDLLDRTIGKWDKKKLVEFRTGRREILWRLESIVTDEKNFGDAAKLLLHLAVAENEDISNNATGVFTQLFLMAPGKLARTHASIKTRLAILEKILNSNDKEERRLGLEACNSALESLHFTRMDYSQNKIVMLKSESWKPGTQEIDAYRKVLEMLCSRLEKMENDEQQKAVDIILGRTRMLARLEPLTDYLIKKLKVLSTKTYVNLEKIISEIEIVLRYDSDKLDPNITQQWEELKKEIHKDDFSFLMQRYVKMDIYTDDFDKEGRRTNKSQEEIKKLANTSIQNKKLLFAEFDWLLTTSAKNSYKFSFELGLLDTNFSILPDILEAQAKDMPNLTGMFLGGYFMAIFQNNKETWESTLDPMVDDPKLCKWVPEITWRSGMTDRAGLRISNLANKGIMKKSDFAMFIYGATGRKLSDEVFLEWIKILLTTPTINDLMIALPLFHEYYSDKESTHQLPEEITLQLITNDLFFGDMKHAKNRVMDEYYWTEISKKFVEQFPNRIPSLMDKIFESMGKDNSIFSSYFSETLQVLDLMSKTQPELVWKSVIKYIGPPLDHKAYRILTWLSNEETEDNASSLLIQISLSKIWELIDVDKNDRASYFTKAIPKKFFHNGKCIAREILIRYGDNKNVRTNLHAHFSSGSWMGSEVDHYMKEKKLYMKFKENENNENILKWIDEHINLLDHDIERAKSMEEREF